MRYASQPTASTATVASTVADGPGFRRSGGSQWIRPAAGVIALSWGAWLLAFGQVVPVKRVRDFRMPEFYEQATAGATNRLKSLLKGGEAVPLPGKGNLWAVEQVQVESYQPDGRTNLMARAPVCIADILNRGASSTGWIEVAAMNGKFHIEGQGFHLEVTNSHFIISNHVRAVISHELLYRYNP